MENEGQNFFSSSIFHCHDWALVKILSVTRKGELFPRDVTYRSRNPSRWRWPRSFRSWRSRRSRCCSWPDRREARCRSGRPRWSRRWGWKRGLACRRPAPARRRCSAAPGTEEMRRFSVLLGSVWEHGNRRGETPKGSNEAISVAGRWLIRWPMILFFFFFYYTMLSSPRDKTLFVGSTH